VDRSRGFMWIIIVYVVVLWVFKTCFVFTLVVGPRV